MGPHEALFVKLLWPIVIIIIIKLIIIIITFASIGQSVCLAYSHLRQGGYAIDAVCPSVCHSFCEQYYWRSSALISLKLGIVIGPTDQKKRFTFQYTSTYLSIAQ